MKTALLHLSIAFIWLFLSADRDLPRFILGMVLGYLVLAAFKDLLPKDGYLKGVTAFLKWLYAFSRALVLSQVRVAQIILLPGKNPITPGFFRLSLGDLTDFEIIILSHSISLTPGTTTVEVDNERRELLIHALEAGNEEATRRDIEMNLLKPLLAFTRP
jgi:multisubunit Na+/H+ antiporter MnhE subunit